MLLFGGSRPSPPTQTVYNAACLDGLRAEVEVAEIAHEDVAGQAGLAGTDLGISGPRRGEVSGKNGLGDKRTGKRGGKVGRTDLGTSGLGKGEVKWEERTWGQADWEKGR